MATRESIAKKVKKARLSKGWTQMQVAEKLAKVLKEDPGKKVSASKVKHVEAARCYPTPPSAWAQVLGIPKGELAA